MPIQRSPAEIFGAFGDALKADIRKCVPATITQVHADRQTVDVQVATNDLLFDDLGNPVSMPAPSISDVPLGCLRGGGFFIWVPVQVGDSVLLVFSDQSADTWRSGTGAPQDPGFAGKHTADSPFAIPAWAPDNKMLQSPPQDAGKVIIGMDGAAAQIKISATDIELGAQAADYVALASKVDAELTKIANTLSTFVPGSGGASFPDPYVRSATGSTLVKSG
jgi:hypothetical protein